MGKQITTLVALLIFIMLGIYVKSYYNSAIPTTNTHTIAKMTEEKDISQGEKAYFAGGCFWCIEGIFDGTPGVLEAKSGYIGGTNDAANYKSVSSGNTQHREGVEVIYDPDIISFPELIDIFWRQIDPTDNGGQFADRGFQYTTALYYSNDEEKNILKKSLQQLEVSKKFKEPIATKILPSSPFYKAEEEHQDYAAKQTLKYNAYKVGSGRAGYIKNTWSDDKAIKKKTLKEQLSPLQYKVTQKDGTEPAFNNKYWDNKEEGIYVDIVDGTPLYSSLDKYASGTGWPSFTKAIDESNILLSEDNTLFSKRIEVSSKNTGNHLGHVFPDGPEDRGGMRHCLNSASLQFVPLDELEENGYGEYIKIFQ